MLMSDDFYSHAEEKKDPQHSLSSAFGSQAPLPRGPQKIMMPACDMIKRVVGETLVPKE